MPGLQEKALLGMTTCIYKASIFFLISHLVYLIRNFWSVVLGLAYASLQLLTEKGGLS